MRFSGDARRGEVEGLLERFASLGDGPSLVVISAPVGFGKTRIVQEFYARLAADHQGEPPFWPPLLVEEDEAFEGQDAVRRRVRHDSFAIEPGAQIPWLWLAPPVGLLPDGTPAPALPMLARQLTVQVPATLKAIEHRNKAALAAIRSAVQTALALLPVPQVLEAAENLYNAGRYANDAIASWRAATSAGPARYQEGLGSDVEVAPVNTLLTNLLSKKDNGLRAVLVLDDAHSLDAATTELARTVLGGNLPVLMIATVWPETLTDPTRPFAKLVRDYTATPRLHLRTLDPLTPTDLAACVRSRYPNSTDEVINACAGRADGNPYALQLMLTLDRTRDAVEDGALQLRPTDIAALPNRLSELLLDHWRRLSREKRRVLAASAVLGETLALDVVLNSLTPLVDNERLLAGFAEGAWLRAISDEGALVEFTETVRHDLAQSQEPHEFQPWEASGWRAKAATVVETLLTLEEDTDTLRSLILRSMLIRLGRLGLIDNKPLLFDTALTLTERALRDWDYPNLPDLLRDLELNVPRHDVRRRVQWLTVRAEAMRRMDKSEESKEVIQEALRISEDLPQEDDAVLRLLSVYALCHRIGQIRRDMDAGLAAATAAEARIAERTEISVDLVAQVRNAKGSVLMSQRNFSAAADVFLELATFADEQFGELDSRSIAARRDYAYCLARVSPGSELGIREELLDRAVRRFGDGDSIPVSARKADVAWSLLRTGHTHDVQRALVLAESAVDSRRRLMGADHVDTTAPRLVWVQVKMRQGLAAERSAKSSEARPLFQSAEAEARSVLEIRRRRNYNLARTLWRYAESLSCLRDPEAAAYFREAIDLYASASTTPPVQMLRSYVWSCRRLGELELLHRLADEHGIEVNSGPDWDTTPR